MRFVELLRNDRTGKEEYVSRRTGQIRTGEQLQSEAWKYARDSIHSNVREGSSEWNKQISKFWDIYLNPWMLCKDCY